MFKLDDLRIAIANVRETATPEDVKRKYGEDARRGRRGRDVKAMNRLRGGPRSQPLSRLSRTTSDFSFTLFWEQAMRGVRRAISEISTPVVLLVELELDTA